MRLPFCVRSGAAYPKSEFVFPGTKPGLPLSDMTLTKVLRDAGLNGKATAHGFRSSFKDWCAEVAKVRDEVSEAALAHKIPDKVDHLRGVTERLGGQSACLSFFTRLPTASSHSYSKRIFVN